MNRLTALKILDKSISLDLEDNLNIETFKNAVKQVGDCEYDENEAAIFTEIILNTLFEKIPYYMIETYLTKLFTSFKCKAMAYDGYNGITRLISDGIIPELIPKIKCKVEIEFLAHLFELIEQYRLNVLLFNNYDKKRLSENIVYPKLTEENFEFYTELMQYQQLEIINKPQKVDIREIISKGNYSNRSTFKSGLKKYVLDNYSKETLTSFEESLKYMLLLTNPVISAAISEAFEEIKESAIKEWKKRENKTTPKQLTLFNYIQ